MPRPFRACWASLALLLIYTTPGLRVPQATAQPVAAPVDVEPEQAYVRLAVVEDGVYTFSANDLAALGLALTENEFGALRLLENGKEVPLWQDATSGTTRFAFVGRRNRGDGEAWAYDGDASLQSSTYYSLYSDTTHYRLVWGGEAGFRYREATPTNQGTPRAAVSRTVHLEEDRHYFFGATQDSDLALYTAGEGFYWHRLAHTSASPRQATLSAPLPGLDAEPHDVHVRLKLGGESGSPHRVQLAARLTAGASTELIPLGEVAYTGYASALLEATFRSDLIPAGDAVSFVVTSDNSANHVPNTVLVDWLEVDYQRAVASPIEHPRLGTVPAGDSDLAFPADARGALLLAPENATAASIAVDGTARLTLTQAEAVWMAAADELRAPLAMTLGRMNNLRAADDLGDVLLLTNHGLEASAAEYRSYREASSVHRVSIVSVQDVYDAYDYGRPTPIAIRRFLHDTQRLPNPPRFLVLWGDARWPDRASPHEAWEVPSFGIYPSDGWFGMQSKGADDWTEIVAIGRITIRSDEAGRQFIDKLSTYENAPIAEWKKRMLLIAGGESTSEQKVLQSYVSNWGRTATGPPVAMDTLRYFKQSEDVLDTRFQDSLRVSLGRGASWVSYFGHSSSYSWEVVTPPPDRFGNAGRLPVVLSMGCRTGTFIGDRFTDRNLPVFGEALVTSSLEGAIAHWGSSALTYLGPSGQLGTYVHDIAFTDSVRTLGMVFLQAKRRFSEQASGSMRRYHLLQYGLIGDPTTHLALPDQPDFHLTADQIRVTPSAPLPADSSLSVAVRLKNRGLTPGDSVTVRLTHRSADGASVAYQRRVPPFGLTFDLTFQVPIRDEHVGESRLQVYVDADDAVAEMDESNNVVDVSQLIYSDRLLTITPPEMGLVPFDEALIRVAASSRSQENAITFELYGDANLTQLITAADVAATKGLADWRPTGLEPGTTYHWRARSAQNTEQWTTGRFTTGPSGAARGWSQQGALFATNQHGPFVGWADGAWRFATYKSSIQMTGERGSGIYKGGITVNGQVYEFLTLGYAVVVVDANTGAVKASGSFPTFEMSDPLKQRFNTDSTRARIALEQLIDGLEVGDHVFARSRHLGRTSGAEIQPHIKALLRRLGSTAVDSLDYTDLWVMQTQVGVPESTQEWVGVEGQNELVIETELAFTFPSSTTTSPLVGPAASWTHASWEAATEDGASIAVGVLSATGDTLIAPVTSGPLSLSSIDAGTHPYLRLHAVLRDTTQRTTPQLEQWRVAYRPVAELAVDAGAALGPIQVEEGQPLTVSLAIVNLHPEAVADRIVVRYTLVDAQNGTYTVASDTLAGLAANQTIATTAMLPTLGFAGANRLVVRAYQLGSQEAVVYNNVAEHLFTVAADVAPPTFEVWMDGRTYPSDPDPVSNLGDPRFPFASSRPRFEIQLSDENPYRSLADTTIFILDLDGVTVPFSDDTVDFLPADDRDRRARLLFEPDLSRSDSTHTLLVRAFDAAGNEAVDSPYQLHFRVQQAIDVEHLYPYPNPMSTATQFAFQLKGADPSLVEDFRIRIYTLTGRPVREFDLLERGELRIGWNQVLWDGRDEDGDQVATGVYLYRVFLAAEGQSLRVNGQTEKIVVLR